MPARLLRVRKALFAGAGTRLAANAKGKGSTAGADEIRGHAVAGRGKIVPR